MKETVRVYSLDIILPECNTSDVDAIIVDINGARSDCTRQRELYGDDRILDTVLKTLAEAGGGIINSVSQLTTFPQERRFNLERFAALINEGCGFYNANASYVPEGDPYALDTEEYTAAAAYRLGIRYRRFYVGWEPELNSFMVHGDVSEPIPLKDWLPSGIVWPYSLDQRCIPIPGIAVCNHPRYAAITTNKLLAYGLGASNGSAATPPSVPSGFWSPSNKYIMNSGGLFQDYALTVIKPLAGRRGFGVLVVPRENLSGILQETGIVAEPDKILQGVNILMAALLWGAAYESLAIIQPYIQPRLTTHPRTADPYAGIVRATVIVKPPALPKCIDACRILMKNSWGVQLERDTLVLSNSGHAGVTELDSKDQEFVHRTSEEFIAKLEDRVNILLPMEEPSELLRAEADYAVKLLGRTCDTDILHIWQQYRSSITICEAISGSIGGERI